MDVPLQAQIHAAYIGYTIESKMRSAKEVAKNCWKLQQLDLAHPV